MRTLGLALVLTFAWIPSGRAASKSCYEFQEATKASELLYSAAMYRYSAIESRSEKIAKAGALIRKLFSSLEFNERYCQRLSTVLTEAEMKSAADFYRSPVGAKIMVLQSRVEVGTTDLVKEILGKSTAEFAKQGLLPFPP